MQHVSSSTDDRQRKLAALTGLALNFGKDLPPELCKMWLRMLAPCTAEAVAMAVEVVIAEYGYKTLPPFAVLADAIRRVSGGVEKDKALELAAAAEWERVMDAVTEKGRYNKPQFDDVTERVVRVMGGWYAFCDMENSKLEWKCKEFVEHWKRYAEYEAVMALPAREILGMINHKGTTQKALGSNLKQLEA